VAKHGVTEEALVWGNRGGKLDIWDYALSYVGARVLQLGGPQVTRFWLTKWQHLAPGSTFRASIIHHAALPDAGHILQVYGALLVHLCFMSWFHALQVYGRQLTALTVGAKLYYQGERINVDPSYVKSVPKVGRTVPATSGTMHSIMCWMGTEPWQHLWELCIK
jgi:hypothetical protein